MTGTGNVHERFGRVQTVAPTILDTVASACSNGGMVEVEVGRLPDGAAFRMACGPFDDATGRIRVTHHLYGIKRYTVGESRVHIVWVAQPQLTIIKQANGRQHSFMTEEHKGSNLPVSVTVEWNPATPNSALPTGAATVPLQKRRHTMDDAQKVALQARYDHARKQQEKAVESGDVGKIEMTEGRVAKIVGEAGAAGVTLTEPEGVASAAHEEAEAPAPVGKVQVGKKTKAQQVVAEELAQTKENKETMATAKKATKVSLKEQNAIRMATLKARAKAAKAEAKDKPKAAAKKAAPKAKKLESTHDCLCGCKQETGGKFRPGHDAKVKGMLYKVERGEITFDSLPATLKPYVKFAGLASSAGKDTSNYRIVKSPVKFPNRADIEITEIK